MNLITLDYETYFSAEYSLGGQKMTTEEYVRDPRFKAHLVGIKFGDAPARAYLPDALLHDASLRTAIADSAAIAHHAHFDGLILSHHFGLRPKFWIDTLSMARATVRDVQVGGSLGKLLAHFGLEGKILNYAGFKGCRDLPPALYREVAAGCVQDVEQTYKLYEILRPYVPDDEMTVIDQVVRMFTEPCLRLDRPRLEKFLNAEKRRKAEAMLLVGESLLGSTPYPTADGVQSYLDAVEIELQSAAKFKLALEALGYPCPMKWSEKQDKAIPALAQDDDGMKELEAHDDSRVQALASARLGVKSTIDETRAQRLLDAGGRGALPVYLSYGAAKTLRFGGGDKTNWQNFRRGGEIRKSILAPEGHKLVIVDSSQIECRLLNWLAGETWVLDAFREGRDIYCETATAVFGRPITKDDKLERFCAKTLELGCGYGLGKVKYQRQMAVGMFGGPPIHLTDDEAAGRVGTYRRTHPQGVRLRRTADDFWLPALASGAEMTYKVLSFVDGMIHGPNGTSLDYQGLRWGYYGSSPLPGEEVQWWAPSRNGPSRYYGGKLVENVVQYLAGVVIRQAMARIGPRYRIVLQVHDEIVCVVPDAEADAALEFCLAEMVRTPVWADADLPLAAEGLVSVEYAK